MSQQETPLAVALQNPVPQSSVELAQSAKGATQVCVKVYCADPDEAERQAIALYDRLVARYAPKEAQP